MMYITKGEDMKQYLPKFIVFLVLILTFFVNNSFIQSLIFYSYLLYLIWFNFRHHPKSSANKISIFLYVFLIIYTVFKPLQNYDLLIISLLIIILGMFVKTLNYNPLIGIRIMTTRNSKTNWRRTHNLMSILSIPFALFLIVLGQFISYKAAILLTFILWLGIPILYSIYIYRNEGI